MNNVYVIDSAYNGLTCAYRSKEKATMEILHAYAQELPSLFIPGEEDAKELIQQISKDLIQLYERGEIEDYAWVHDIPVEE